MSTPVTYPTHDETIAAIRMHANTGTEKFVAKVYRRAAGDVSSGTLLAIFEDVTYAHLATPEAWMQSLWGGGDYRIRVLTPWNDDKTQGGEGIAGLLRHQVPGPQLIAPRFEAMEQEGYSGPTLMTFPTRGSRATGAAGATAQAFQGFSSTPLSALQAAQVMPGPASTSFDRSIDAERQRALEMERQEFEVRKRRYEQEMMENRIKMEREAAEQKAAASLAQLRAEMTAQAAAAVRPPADIGGIISAVVGAAAPLVSVMMESGKQRAEAEREARRIEAEARKADSERLMALLAKPNGPDPMVEFILRSMDAQAKNNAEMTSRMVEAMGATSKMAVSMIETVADLNLGGQPEGHPVLDAVKEGVKALVAMNSSTTMAAKKSVAQKTLPPARPAAVAAPVAPVAPVAPGAPAPVPVTHFAAPVTPPARPRAAAFDEAPAPEDSTAAFHPRAGETCVDVVERMIRARHQPVEELAAYIIGTQENPDMVEALEEFDDDLAKLCGSRLGEWLDKGENMVYLQQLAGALQAMSETEGEEGEEGEE